MRGRFPGYAAIASQGRRPFYLVGLSDAFVSEKSRTAYRHDSGKRSPGEKMHCGRNRSRCAERKRTLRSCTGLGRVWGIEKRPTLNTQHRTRILNWTLDVGR